MSLNLSSCSSAASAICFFENAKLGAATFFYSYLIIKLKLRRSVFLDRARNRGPVV